MNRSEDAAPELASPEQVRILEGYNYRRAAVRKWPREKAVTVIHRCRAEERIAQNRALRVARDLDGVAPRGQPSVLERLSAAAYIEGVLSERCEVDELLQALAYSLYVSTDDELKRLAGYLIRLYRGEQAQGAARPGASRPGASEIPAPTPEASGPEEEVAEQCPECRAWIFTHDPSIQRLCGVVMCPWWQPGVGPEWLAGEREQEARCREQRAQAA
jgi:hypothetical protein